MCTYMYLYLFVHTYIYVRQEININFNLYHKYVYLYGVYDIKFRFGLVVFNFLKISYFVWLLTKKNAVFIIVSDPAI